MFTDVSEAHTALLFTAEEKRSKQAANLHAWLNLQPWKWMQYVPPKH
jgi:hypothetical protein